MLGFVESLMKFILSMGSSFRVARCRHEYSVSKYNVIRLSWCDVGIAPYDEYNNQHYIE